MADAFQELTESAARDLGHAVVRWLPAGVLVADAAGLARELNLVNLARRVKPAPQAEWPELIRDFLAVALAAPQGFGTLADNADRLRPRLGLAFPDDSPSAPFARPVPGTDLVVNLVVDAERHMTYATAADVAGAGGTPGEWVNLALDNLLAATPADWLAVVHADTGVVAGNAGDGYDAARALVLHRLVPGAAGHFVAVPSRDWLFALPASAAALDHLGVVHAAARDTFAADPYPVSPRVYWVDGAGAWEALDLDASASGGVRFAPSPRLLAAVGA